MRSDWQPEPYKEYRWIVADPQLLGGKLAIRGTLSPADIDEAFDHGFPHEVMPEVLRVASELTDSLRVIAPGC